MADIKLKPGTIATVLSTELNSLASGSGSAASGNVNQDTDLELEAIFELAVDFVSAPTAESLVTLLILPKIDGTNQVDYTSGASEVYNAHSVVGAFVLKATTAAQRVQSPIVKLPGCDFTVAVVNESGQAFPASGSTVKILPWHAQTV